MTRFLQLFLRAALMIFRIFRRKHKHKISILVPFKADYSEREEIWKWLKKYWKAELPKAEIVMGTDHRTPFSKSVAVNDAFRKSKGDVIVILDADAYFPGHVIKHCAHRIREARKHDRKLWFIPYRRFYRLTKEISAAVLASDPVDPLRLPSPIPTWMVDESWTETSGVHKAHFYGALVQIMPREAFEAVGGWDERFASWGGEDISFVRAVDTLYGHHKTLNSDVTHLWHEKIGTSHQNRQWEGADHSRNNNWLTSRYGRARGVREEMRALVDEALNNAHPSDCKCYDCR